MTIKEMQIELENLQREEREEEQRNARIFDEYMAMTGKYAVKVCSPEDCGQGYCGYHYEYDDTMKEKEDEERRLFLEENNYIPYEDIRKKYSARINELQEQISIAKYGMTRRERLLYHNIQNAEKEIERLKAEIKEWTEELNQR